MIMQAYSIFDLKALHYHLPFFAPNDAVAIRSLGDLVNDPQSRISQHPADYVLYRVGHYDDATGGVQPVSPLVHVIDAVALVRLPPAGLFTESVDGNGDRVTKPFNGKEF